MYAPLEIRLDWQTGLEMLKNRGQNQGQNAPLGSKFLIKINQVNFVIMPPTLKKLMGHITFGVCVCMRAWVRASHFFALTVTFRPLKLKS